MKIIYVAEFETDFGTLILGDFEGKLCLCDWKFRKMRTQIDLRIKKGLNADFKEDFTDLHQKAIKELTAYFTMDLKIFSLPLQFVGTVFQQQVWGKLQEIKFGETTTYLQLAKNLGNQKAIRSVASANGANALSIIIPCHRVIGTNQEMIGYAGGIPAKKKLLELENPIFKSQLSIF